MEQMEWREPVNQNDNADETDYRQLYQQSEENLEYLEKQLSDMRKRLSEAETEAFRYRTAFKLIIKEIKS